MKTITIGADPELFVSRGNQFVSGHGMIPGTKQNPFKVMRGAVQVDGMALEFNIDPAENRREFVHSIESVMKSLLMMVPEGCQLQITPTARFSEEEMKSQPEEALRLGCDPDFNAYEMEANRPPDGNTNLRTASGHVHVGWTENEKVGDPNYFAACATLIRQLDWYLGLPSILLDDNTERRSMYGKAGAFRPKPYGAEYRVLSNFWLRSEELMGFVFDSTLHAVHQLMNGDALSATYPDVNVQDIINSSDKKAARAAIRLARIEVP